MPLSAPAQISQALAVWFLRDGKDYPWRQTTDAYAILVSELMLQQTQISTVLDRGYYKRWMERFPDLPTLAAAEEGEVLRTWEGLGYYRRARFLHRIAQEVVQHHGGRLPDDAETLRKLPGIGAYTLGAVMSFAHDRPFALVDGNVARVLTRLGNEITAVDSTAGQAWLWQQAEMLLAHATSPRLHNSALMELGQTICKTGQPDCIRCPVKTWCIAKDPASLPVKGKRTTITEVDEHVCFLQVNGKVLLEQELGKRRTGLWKLPHLEAAEDRPLLHKTRYTITRYRVSLFVHEAPRSWTNEDFQPPLRLVSYQELSTLPMPSPYRKALVTLLQTQDFALEN
jgi:A/G-specific adenine glycosylase